MADGRRLMADSREPPAPSLGSREPQAHYPPPRLMPDRRSSVAFLALALLASPALAQSSRSAGETLVKTQCAPCHAIARTGASPNPNAPPLRVELRNAKDEAVVVRVLEMLPGDWTMLSETHPHSKESSRLAAWNIAVPADGKSVRLFGRDHEGWLTMDATATLA